MNTDKKLTAVDKLPGLVDVSRTKYPSMYRTTYYVKDFQKIKIRVKEKLQNSNCMGIAKMHSAIQNC